MDKVEKEKFIITDDPNVHSENTVKIKNLNLLPLLIKVLGSDVLSLHLMGTDMANLSSFLKGCQYKWDYRSPESVYPLIDAIKIPLDLQSVLMNTTEHLNKKLVHKKREANVMVSTPIKFGNFFGFRGFTDLDELHSDHISDHLDGIKIFEAARQATLAAFHLAGMSFDTSVALMKSQLQYVKYVETTIPYFIEILPVCRPDGGAMYAVFSLIQNNEVVTKGYFDAYTFRSKQQFVDKRKQMKEEARKNAQSLFKS